MHGAGLRCLVFVGSWALGALDATAGERPRLLLAPVDAQEPVGGPAAARFQTLLRDELTTRDGELEVADGDKAQGAAVLLSQGKKQLAALELAEAVETLRGAVERGLADPATANFTQVIEGYVLLAVASQRMGNEKAARTALATVVRLSPAFKLSGTYPAAFKAELEKARAQQAKVPRGGVLVEGPPGAIAWLDGKKLGPVPIKKAAVVSYGRHYVKVQGTGSQRWGQAVDVISDKPVKVKAPKFEAKAAAAPASPPLNLALIDSELLRRLEEACEAVGADYALLVLLAGAEAGRQSAHSALYSRAAQAVSVLPTFALEGQAVKANVAALQLVDEVVARMRAFPGADALPVDLARAGVPSGGGPEPRPPGGEAPGTPSPPTSKP